MSLFHQPKPEPVGVLASPHTDGLRVGGGVFREQRAEAVAEIVGEVRAQVPGDSAALGEQGMGLGMEAVVVETGGSGGAGQQGAEQLGLLGGEAVAAHARTARMAASSAASSASGG